jgi:hypothetical protein
LVLWFERQSTYGGFAITRARKTAIFAAAVVSVACCLGCVTIALSVVGYQPAVVAAPDHEMHWPTQPGLWASVVKSYQRFFEIRPCEHTVLGWSAEGTLFYQEARGDSHPQAWAYDPDEGTEPRWVEAAPVDLLQEAIPRSSILEWVRSPRVRPADAEPMVRNLKVRVDSLASPDGRWVAVIVRHIYGPEDVIILGQ